MSKFKKERFDSDVFIPPFRLGRRQKRAVLDAKGREVIVMPHKSEKQGQMYCDYLNATDFHTFLTQKYPLYADGEMHVNLTVNQLLELVGEWENKK